MRFELFAPFGMFFPEFVAALENLAFELNDEHKQDENYKHDDYAYDRKQKRVNDFQRFVLIEYAA